MLDTSADHPLVGCVDTDLSVGDTVQSESDYSAPVRSMPSPFVARMYEPLRHVADRMPLPDSAVARGSTGLTVMAQVAVSSGDGRRVGDSSLWSPADRCSPGATLKGPSR